MPTISPYWHSVFERAFWDSFRTFETNPRLLLLGLLVAVVTAALVFFARGRKAFKEHIITNIGIAFGGALITWLLVFVWIFIHLPAKMLTESTVNLDAVIKEKREQSIAINSLTEKAQNQEARITTLEKRPSNIVKGEKPTEVAKTSPTAETAPEFHWARTTAPPVPQYGTNAEEFLLMTTKVMNGGHARITCNKKINQGTAALVGVSVLLEGSGGMLDEHTFQSGIDSPNWSPDHPLMITIYYDGAPLGPCQFTPLQ